MVKRSYTHRKHKKTSKLSSTIRRHSYGNLSQRKHRQTRKGGFGNRINWSLAGPRVIYKYKSQAQYNADLENSGSDPEYYRAGYGDAMYSYDKITYELDKNPYLEGIKANHGLYISKEEFFENYDISQFILFTEKYFVKSLEYYTDDSNN